MLCAGVGSCLQCYTVVCAGVGKGWTTNMAEWCHRDIYTLRRMAPDRTRGQGLSVKHWKPTGVNDGWMDGWMG